MGIEGVDCALPSLLLCLLIQSILKNACVRLPSVYVGTYVCTHGMYVQLYMYIYIYIYIYNYTYIPCVHTYVPT